MGQSTDAILFYGYCWDEETRKPWTIGNDDKDDDWQERYARAKGESEPSEPYPNRPRQGFKDPEWTEPERRIVDAYSAHWDRKLALVEASGCKVGTHCSSECPMPYVAVTASEIRSWRGHMNQITSLDVQPQWQALLDEFCKTLGIKIEGLAVGWWLVSNWS